MKKIFAKLLSLLLVVAMLVNNFSPLVVMVVNAQENDGANTGSETTEKVTVDDIKPKGDIEVETHFVLPIRNRQLTDITLTIYDAEKKNSAVLNLNDVTLDGTYETTLSMKNNEGVQSQNIRTTVTKRNNEGYVIGGEVVSENIVYFSINLYSLDAGKYTLEFSGKNFVTYSVDVELTEFSKRVSITDGKGMFEIGDINNDNKVDITDEELMIREIESNGTNYDLNLDGVVDIADLNYITAIINGTSGTATIENTSVIMDSSNVSFEIPSGTYVDEESLKNLFVEDKTVSLMPTNGEISEENPVSLALDLGNQNSGEAVEMSEVRIGVGEENVPKKLTLLVLTEDGVVEQFGNESIVDVPSGVHLFTDEVTDGTIRVDLGKQIAVKKVTIRITETSSNSLADIAKVEFLNNVKVETKAPEGFDIPQNIHVDDTKSEQLTVTFNDVPNVTGYEIKIVGPKMESGKIFQTTFTTFTIEDLKNYETYNIFVQSVNQEWRSGWSTTHKGTPQATRIPPKVDMVEAKGTFGGIDFSWKKMDDTQYYKLYYREVGANEFTVIDDIYNSSYQLRGLKPGTEYEAYIIGVNELGESDSYTLVKGTTNAIGAAKVPKYKLINDKLENGKTVHIEDVILGKGTMTNDNKFAMYDDDPSTYWSVETWAAGSHYNKYQMPTTVFDQTYEIDEIVFTVPDEFKYSFKAGTYDEKSDQYSDTLVYYWNTTEEDKTSKNVTGVVPGIISAKKDDDGRLYYLLKLKDPIEANAIQLGLTNSSSQNLVQISEIKIYEYDSLVDDVADLFTDDLRLTLRYDKETTKLKIADLRTRANTMDHEEYSPYKASVEADLDYAEKILNDEKIDDVITLDPNISNTYNNHLKFAMTISDYQPLGIVVRPGVDKTINVYVGSKGKVNAEIVFTQYHAEANAWNLKSVALKSGLNVIDVPTIGSDSTTERGGSIYIRYTGEPDVNNPIRVRVSGGTKIPMIDITDLTNEQEKKDAIKKYIEELTTYNASLTKVYSDEGTSFVPKSSVLGSTELVTKRGLFSVSSVAVETGLKKSSTEDDKVNQLYESLEAFDEMMDLFYRQKGLSYETDVASDKAPKARINIRYMKMFDGAFMYAGGYHVGIEYDSIPGLVQGKKNSEEGTGYFGWGISHEVGHQINLNSTVFAEVTNNVYSLLAQTSNDKDVSRLESSKIYDKIYDKVTSHTTGRAQNVFVQLGMYWQLHLAYDENKTFDDNDSIYAKVNRIARSYNNINGYTRDELTILFASMAAKKDLTEFFEAWGLKADEQLREEINSIEGVSKETRPIYYLNDAARRYKLSKASGITDGANILTANMENADSQEKRVTITFSVSSDSSDKILGYEILRNGVSIGFVENDTNEFVDNIGAENNRAYTYEVVAYDYYLNKTNKVTLEEVKISHEPSIKKDTFTISSNVKEPGEVVDYENEELDDSKLKVNNLIDGKTDTGFKGTEKIKVANQPTGNGNFSMTTDDGNAYVIINLNNSMSISGIKYRALVENGELDPDTIKKYKIYVSEDGEDWSKVARTGEFSLTAENDYTATVYFQKPGTTSETQLWTFDNIGYVKIESVGSAKLSGAEIDVIAPPGDNIDISEDISIGKLEKSYCYNTDGCPADKVDENGDVIGLIKEGSVIIKGSYRGTPSLNVVVIADKDNVGNKYNGYGLLFAEVNDDMTVYDVADGTWLYVMTQKEYEDMLAATTSIRAYLYRVNDALEKSGQRITSTSKAITSLPSYEELQSMTIESSDGNQ